MSSAKHELDLSLLEPPVPIEKTLDAVEGLVPGHYLSILYPREPVPLFALLDQLGIVYQSMPGPDNTWKLLAWRDGDAKAEAAIRADNDAQDTTDL